MILLLGLFCLIWGEPTWSIEKILFNEDIQQVAVGNNNLYVATTETLHQLWHNLILIHSLTLKGILKNVDQPGKEDFQRVSEKINSNTTFSVNVLLPFVRNETLISCGVKDQKLSGYCEVLDLKSISKILYREHIQVGPQRSSRGSVSFLVDVKKDSVQTETYILTAIQNHRDKIETINLHNTDQTQNGGLFSGLDQSGSSSPGIQAQADLEFVDGFQINSTVYLFSNVASEAKTNKVRLIWLQAETSKSETLKSLRGATLSTSDGGNSSRLLASSVIPGGQQVLWCGVFSVDGGETNTQLLLFDISPDQSRRTNTDPDFYSSTNPNNASEPESLTPKVVLFKKKYMISVLAVKQDSWTVIFIGTSNGQLIKLPVDKNNLPGCPKEQYRVSGNQRAFSKIHLDPVDHGHVYLLFKNKIERVPVSNCSEYKSVKKCCTAQDPFCVWCVSKKSCTFKDNCKDGWLSIPDESRHDVVSHRAKRDSTGQVKVVVQVHLTVEQKLQSNFTCQISDQLCRPDGPQPQYPQCTCILTKPLDSNELDVNITVTFGNTKLTETIKLMDCSTSSLSLLDSGAVVYTDLLHQEGEDLPMHAWVFSRCQQCIRAGCGWRQNSCSWASEGVQDDNDCQNVNSQQNIERPEITSITPNFVSLYGRNHALLTGRNVRYVVGVKVQAELDCSSEESPVWNNTGVSLTFHIPRRANEAVAKVCALLSDGSCHGEAEIIYQSSPSCSSISPITSWTSGKRKITIVGSYLDSVEGVLHGGYSEPQEILERINSKTLTYITPVGKTSWRDDNRVLLKVANETLDCQKEIYYPDPQFHTFIAKRTGKEVLIMIQSTDWNLKMTTEELSVWGVKDDKRYPCIMKGKNKTKTKASCFVCEIQNATDVKFSQITIKYGEMTVQVWNPPLSKQYLLILRLLLVPCVTAVLGIICHCLLMKNKP